MFTSCSFSATALATSRLFSPISINTVLMTTSRPSCVAAPERSSRPRPTWATSRTRTGTLSLSRTTIAPRASISPACPGTRINHCAPLCSINPAPWLELLSVSALMTSSKVSPRASNFTGSGATSTSFLNPPMGLISATPDTRSNWGRMIQSCTERRLVGVTVEPSALRAPGVALTVNIKISPKPVEIGPMAGSSSWGSSPLTAFTRSATCCRAK